MNTYIVMFVDDKKDKITIECDTYVIFYDNKKKPTLFNFIVGENEETYTVVASVPYVGVDFIGLETVITPIIPKIKHTLDIPFNTEKELKTESPQTIEVNGTYLNKNFFIEKTIIIWQNKTYSIVDTDKVALYENKKYYFCSLALSQLIRDEQNLPNFGFL